MLSFEMVFKIAITSDFLHHFMTLLYNYLTLYVKDRAFFKQI